MYVKFYNAFIIQTDSPFCRKVLLHVCKLARVRPDVDVHIERYMYRSMLDSDLI